MPAQQQGIEINSNFISEPTHPSAHSVTALLKGTLTVINAELPASTGPLAAEGGQHLPKIQYCEVQVWELDSATGFATRKQYWALGSQSVNGTKTEAMCGSVHSSVAPPC